MKKYVSILCILSIGYILLFTNCSKATVAQISFSVSLASDTVKIQGYIIPGSPSRSVRAKYFPLVIKINATEKAVGLYPDAQLYLKYQMFDTTGKEMPDGYLYEKLTNTSGTLFSQFFNKLAPNVLQQISKNLSAISSNDKTYNIVRIDDTLSTRPYKIVFTLVVKDSAKNESLPAITPKEAQRTLEVIISPNNPNQASYILSYNKNLFFPQRKIEINKLDIYWAKKEYYSLWYNKYLKIIG